MMIRSPLRQAFVVTVAMGASALAPACNSSVFTSDTDTCPETPPNDGDACGSDELSCNYGDCPRTLATCRSNRWSVLQGASCNPPPPACPTDLPVAGTSCEDQAGPSGDYPSGCDYSVTLPCGEQTAIASCIYDDDTQTWQWEVETPDCMSTGDACAEYDDAGMCGNDSGCRWLVPGCAPECEGCPPAAPEGCFPIDDCTPGSCDVGQTCTTVVHDICWDSLCNACGGEVAICTEDA